MVHRRSAAGWQGQAFSLTLTLPDAVQRSGLLPVDDIPDAVSAVWQMAWIDSALQLGANDSHAGRARSFQGVEVSDDATVPADLQLGDRLLGGDDPINAIFDPTEVWQGLTVEWTHVWDTTAQQGFSGLAFPALRPGGLDLGQGWGLVSIGVWQVSGDASGAPLA